MRLINADKLKEEVSNSPLIDFTDDDIFKLIDNAPTVDCSNELSEMTFSHALTVEERQDLTRAYLIGRRAEQRPQGEWMGDTDLDGTCKCSKCRMTFDTDRLKMVMCDSKYELPPSCPNCGADMRKNETQSVYSLDKLKSFGDKEGNNNV